MFLQVKLYQVYPQQKNSTKNSEARYKIMPEIHETHKSRDRFIKTTRVIKIMRELCLLQTTYKKAVPRKV